MANNAYPELPVLDYKKTIVPMADVIASLRRQDIPNAVRRAVYVIFRIESANGTKGINNNYGGIQADGQRWQAQYDALMAGTVVLKENTTKKERRFVAFKSFEGFLALFAGRLQARGIYVGGTTHKIVAMKVRTPAFLAEAYYKEWVTGDAAAVPPRANVNNFLSMYAQAEKLFP
ncbi:MAG: hypothetical protein EOP50_01650 [Sphingobacteriales bacterium]|nr:MAG: hypothetical protein EOP50_01650 [Sphingobacteriales bacterium]